MVVGVGGGGGGWLVGVSELMGDPSRPKMGTSKPSIIFWGVIEDL